MALPGMGGMGLGGRQSAGMDPQQAQEQQMINYVSSTAIYPTSHPLD